MPSDVIKNPARKEKIIKPYEPEYKRLDLEPQINEINPRVFIKNKSTKQMVENNQQQLFPKSLSIEAEDVVPQISQHVVVGHNNNWFDNSQESKSLVMEIEKNVTLDVEQDAVSKDENLEVSEDQVSIQISPSLTNVEPDNFCLLLRGDIIAISESKDSLLSFIESILFDSDPKFKDITINDLYLFKRLPLKVGVVTIE